MTEGGGGVRKSLNLRDVIYEWPLTGSTEWNTEEAGCIYANLVNFEVYECFMSLLMITLTKLCLYVPTST